MNENMAAATISAVVSLLVAVLSQSLSSRQEAKLKNLEFRLEKYSHFLAAFAGIGGPGRTYEAHEEFAKAFNVVSLLASPPVLREMYALFAFVQSDASFETDGRSQQDILNSLVVEIRRELGHAKNSSVAGVCLQVASPGGVNIPAARSGGAVELNRR